MCYIDDCFKCLCCCWVIQVVGAIKVAIKVAITIIPTVLIATLGATLSCIVYLPKNFFYSYYVILCSPQFGLNVKILLFLTAWIPLITHPMFVCVISLIGSIFAGIFVPYVESYGMIDEQCDMCISTKIWSHSIDYVTGVNDVVSRIYYDIVSQYNINNGVTYDIPIVKIIVGFFVTVVSSVFTTVMVSILCMFKYFPCVLKAIVDICRLWSDVDIFRGICFPLMLVCIVLTIPVTFLISVLFVVFYLFLSFGVTIEYVKTESINRAFSVMFNNIYEFDMMINRYMRDDRRGYDENVPSCFSCWKARSDLYEEPPIYISHQQMPVSSASQMTEGGNNSYYALDFVNSMRDSKKLSISTIWNAFFVMCTSGCTEALQAKLCTLEDVEACLPELFVGIPSYVILNAVIRSIGSNGVLLHDMNTIVTQENCPIDMFSKATYDKMIKMKELYNTIKPNQFDEIMYIKKWLITVGNNEKCKNEISNVGKERIEELNKLCSSIQELAISATQMPLFKRDYDQAIKNSANQYKQSMKNKGYNSV